MVEQQKTNVSEGEVRKRPYDVDIPTLENERQDMCLLVRIIRLK